MAINAILHCFILDESLELANVDDIIKVIIIILIFKLLQYV